MDKVKELYTKFKTWHNEEAPYTNGDAFLLLVLGIYVVVHSLVN